MDWADELAASAVAAAGRQRQQDARPGRSTSAACAARSSSTSSPARCVPTAIETTLLYGVDDLDPMDAQALLTPDAVDHEMGRPLAHVPDQAGDCHASYARHHAQIFIDTFAGLGIRPDRYYWMSDIYPTGRDGPVHPDGARPGRRSSARSTGASPTSSTPTRWHPVGVDLRDVRQGRHDDRHEVGRRAGVLRVPAGPRHLGARLRHVGLGQPRSAGAAKLPWNLEWAAQWSLFGVTIEPCGKDLSTAGGSRDRSDAIAREVFEREPPLNVPYEFLNIGGRKMSTSKGRGAAAHRIVEVVPPEQLRLLFLRPRPNQAIEFDPDGTDADPAPVRRVRPARRGDGRARGQGRAARRLRGRLPLLAARPDRRRGDRGRRVPADLQPPRAARRRSPAWTSRPGSRRRRGAPLDRARAGILDERLAAARAWLDDVRAGACPHRRSATSCRPRRSRPGRGPARSTSAPRAGGRARARRPAATPGRTLIFATRRRAAALPAGRAFGAIYLAFLGRTNGPRAGWLLASLDPAFVIGRLRAAAGWSADGGAR